MKDPVKQAAASPWAKAPDRENTIGSSSPTKDPEKEELIKKGLFTPKLDFDESSSALRNRVRSSGYGKAIPMKTYEDPIPQDVKDAEGATFKPDLKSIARPGTAGYNMRKKVQSSGYGKAVPSPKRNPKAEKPSFTPEIKVSKRTEKLKAQAPSSGYGKVIASPAKAPEAEKPSFKPNIDIGKRAKQLRKKAPPQTYLQPPRPRTAPPADASYNAANVLRYTLAADKTETMSDYEADDDKPPFQLDCNQIGAMAKPLPFPQPVQPWPAGEKIKKNAQSSSYGPDFEPPHVPAPDIEPEPIIKFGNPSQVYMDSPDKLPPAKHSKAGKAMLQKVQSSGFTSSAYAPKVAELPEKEPEPLWRPTTANANLTPATELPPTPKSDLTARAASSAYGVVSPPMGERPEPKPASPRFDTSNRQTTLLSIEQLSFEPTKLKSKTTDDVDEDLSAFDEAKRLAEAEAAAQILYNGIDEEEKVTIMPL